MDNETARPALWGALERPVFIVGVERSGTTLLRSVLTAHPSFAVSPETHFMRLADSFGADEREAPEDFAAFWQALEKHLEPRAIGVDLQRVRALVDEGGARDFRNVFAALLAAQAEAAGKPRAGEKTPGHEHYIDRLLDWFPGARVIFVHRDPRACAASVLHAPWVKAQLHPARFSAPLVRRTRALHVAFKAEEWITSHRVERARSGDSRVCSIAYEDLVTAPAPVLERLCAFLGERFAPDMVENKAASLIDPDKSGLRWRDWIVEHEARAASPITTDRLESWRTELSPSEIAMMESVCAEGMAAFGYPPALSAPALRDGQRQFERVLLADRLEHSGRRALLSLLRGKSARVGLAGLASQAEPAVAALAAAL